MFIPGSEISGVQIVRSILQVVKYPLSGWWNIHSSGREVVKSPVPSGEIFWCLGGEIQSPGSE